MTLREMTEHFAYGRWANQRTLQALADLTEEQVTRDLGSSFHSIRDTLAHVAGAEWIWMRRWRGDAPSTFPEALKAARVEEIARRLEEVDAERTAFLATLTDADLLMPRTYTLFNGRTDTLPLEAQMLHVVNHSTYHRGQIAGMIRQVGGTPVSTDLIAYRRQLAASA